MLHEAMIFNRILIIPRRIFLEEGRVLRSVFFTRVFSSREESKRNDNQTTMDIETETHRDKNRPVNRFVSVDLKSEIHGSNSNNSEIFFPKDIDFENHIEAFKGKSTKEILRALCVLRFCAVDVFVDNSLRMMTWSRRVLGRRGLRYLFKSTFYNQFVGGETHREIQDCMKRLLEIGIRPMLATTMEEDVGEGGNESVYDCNYTRIMECMEIISAEPTPSPMFQLKLSGLLPADVLVDLGDLYATTENKIELIKILSQGLLDEETLDVKSLTSKLNEDKITILKNALKRLKKIGTEAQTRGIKILVDAEFTYLNKGLSFLTLAMAAVFNKDSAIIWNTYQCYLKNALSKVEEEIKLTNELKVCLGAKLVRGAYSVQERMRATKLNIEDPICVDKQATDNQYNKILKLLLAHIKKEWPKFVMIIASHNEESIKAAITSMKALNINQQNGGVYFGQLFGMCDQVTYPLANSGYEVYKSIPYGSLEEVLPYLARRAQENKSVLEGSRKEQSLLWKEFKNRIGLKRQQRT